MKIVILLLIGCCTLVAMSFGFAKPAARTAQTVQAQPYLPGPAPFVDTFDAISSTVWNVSDGWRNGSWTINDWRRSTVRVQDGLLISLNRNKTNLAEFSGGEVQSREKFGHGYYEIRMRAAPASGTVTGFFTYTGPPIGDPWDEIDIEILGAKPKEALLSYYRAGEKVSKVHQLGFDATTGTNTYGFDWQPNYIRWYVNRRLVHEAIGDALPLPVVKQKLIVSLWGSRELESWVGPFNAADMPTTTAIACISFSESFMTGQKCPQPKRKS